MTMHFFHYKRRSILEQLHLEEALLRFDERNFCIVSKGSCPAIVLGISAVPHELVHMDRGPHIPLIRRFSGGGTVIVDEDTLFVTFICQKALHPFAVYPETIMRWTEGLYRPAFSHPEFALRDNDYVIGEKKCGGNAQYFRKERYLHHTSFLWDYKEEHMRLLRMPRKTPSYRQGRAHSDFLCTLKPHFKEQEELFSRLKNSLAQSYLVKEIQEEEILSLMEKSPKQSTIL